MKNGYILMLEADAQDKELSTEYFKAREIACEFLSYSNEVMTFLNRKLIENQPLPAVIIVSLHAVPDTGFFVLQEVKVNDYFNHIPVVVLGENTNSEMIKRCYAAGANTFINKPFTNEETSKKINLFLDYWMNVAELTHRHEATI
ncbi:MAG: response regulator [Bacteroidia bacterium]